MIAEVALQNDLPGRQAPRPNAVPRRKQRRFRAGRDRRLGIKTSAETQERLYKAADARNLPLDELLRQALDALEKAE